MTNKEIEMANKYSKGNFVNKDDGNKSAGGQGSSQMKEYEERRKRLNTSAKIMAIVVSIAMIVTAFLSAGVFFLQ